MPANKSLKLTAAALQVSARVQSLRWRSPQLSSVVRPLVPNNDPNLGQSRGGSRAAAMHLPGGEQAGLPVSEIPYLFREWAFRGDSGRNGQRRAPNSQRFFGLPHSRVSQPMVLWYYAESDFWGCCVFLLSEYPEKVRLGLSSATGLSPRLDRAG